jgi:hypothetical protein
MLAGSTSLIRPAQQDSSSNGSSNIFNNEQVAHDQLKQTQSLMAWQQQVSCSMPARHSATSFSCSKLRAILTWVAIELQLF